MMGTHDTQRKMRGLLGSRVNKFTVPQVQEIID